MPSAQVEQEQPSGSGSRRDRVAQQAAEPVEVGREQREDLLLADALARLDAGVHVGDQRDRGVALPQLPGQDRLRVPVMLISVQPWAA